MEAGYLNPDCKFNGNIYCGLCDGYIKGLNFLGQRWCKCEYLGGAASRLFILKSRIEEIPITGQAPSPLIPVNLFLYIYNKEGGG
jgi:hypothetical protein